MGVVALAIGIYFFILQWGAHVLYASSVEPEEVYATIFIGSGIALLPIGFLIVASGQMVSCMASTTRNTATTNNILIENQAELLEALKEKS